MMTATNGVQEDVNVARNATVGLSTRIQDMVEVAVTRLHLHQTQIQSSVMTKVRGADLQMKDALETFRSHPHWAKIQTLAAAACNDPFCQCAVAACALVAAILLLRRLKSVIADMKLRSALRVASPLSPLNSCGTDLLGTIQC
jgi:hypothetical protein